MAALTVLGQLAAARLVLALERADTSGPAFRAENSNPPATTAAFWMIEPEAAFFGLAGGMSLAGSSISDQRNF